MNVIFSDSSLADLTEIVDYIADDNRERAQSFVTELEAACFGLSQYPERFQIVPRYASFGIRRRVHAAYSIFYVIADDTVQILRVLNSARDVDPLLPL